MRKVYWYIVLLVVVVGVALVLRSRMQPAYKNSKLSVEERVEDLLRRMTPEEKAAMLAGASWMETQPNQRLGIPAIKMADGPAGVRNWRGPSAVTNAPGATPVYSTSFPSGIALAATWDTEMVGRVARAIAQQTKAHGRDMILAPTVNINRIPLWGRNFEGYGEDPYLAAQMGVAFIKAVQAERVIPSIKHYAANNQEFERHRVDVKIDERALHEIYLPAFKAAVEAGVWAVMSAYNKVNGQWCSENPHLLKEILKNRWGFKGFVISDWGSTYSTEGPINAGLDLEMPGGEPMKTWLSGERAKKAGNSGGWLTADKVLAAVSSGKVKQEAIDDSVRRMLRVMFEAGLFDTTKQAVEDVETAEHRALARAAAAEGIVLLKNAGNLLPLDAEKIKSLAVIGPNAATARTGGGGSSLVRPKSPVSPLDGIKEAAGNRIDIGYALGVSMEGEDASKDTPEARAALRKEAVALAAKSDAAVVVVGLASTLESESFDRKTMDLPAGQDELIQAVAAANKKTIVVVVAGSPVTMTRWIDSTPAVLMAWYGGQEGGHAIADVLFGAVNPSGKLPVTFPKRLTDNPAMANYPGKDFQVAYAEGIYVGYRGFDKKNIEPLFPFGYGLSYSKFDYSDLRINPAKVEGDQPVEVSLQVINTGPRAGAEVVQLYLSDIKASLDRPVKELKGFRRVVLEPGQSQTVTFTLNREAMSFYSPQAKGWVAEPGEFQVLVGASSRDIRLKGSFELTK